MDQSYSDDRTSEIIQYKVHHSQSLDIWHKKLQDCKDRLVKENQREMYHHIDNMDRQLKVERKSDSKFEEKDTRYIQGVVTTVDAFDDVLDTVENAFPDEYDFDNVADDDLNHLGPRGKDLWWVGHHMKTMSKKSETVRSEN